ncbi:uncharacterized protein LOC134245102 [Saccostrea cucullata]|uniref:uncharacterized protein LOC134245102 n=1 Tax=Saccostrea cuccullata TaxID=36930 RepID=UPI002ED2FA6E
MNRTRSRSRVRRTESVDDPNNWTVDKLKYELKLCGIDIKHAIPHKILVKLWLDNKEKKDRGTDGETEHSELAHNIPSAVRNEDRNLVQQCTNTTERVYEVPASSIADTSVITHVRASSYTDGNAVPENAHAPTRPNITVPERNVNNENSVLMATAVALQETVKLIQQSTKDKEEEDYSLRNFYENRSSATFAAGSSDQLTQTQMQPNLFKSTMRETSTSGVPSSDLQHVMAVSPTIRKEIISVSAISQSSSTGRPESNQVSPVTPSFMGLQAVVNKLWDRAIGDKTRRQYQIGFQNFLRFVTLMNLTSYNGLPIVCEKVFIQYVSYCHSELQLSYSTIKLYLSGIRYIYLRMGGFNPLESNGKPLQGLQTILSGIKKSQCNRDKRIRLPITIDILTNLCLLLDQGLFDEFTDSMLKSVCTLAFFGFLRCGEFTIDDKFVAANHLCIDDLKIFEDHLVLTLKRSKTDPFRNGVSIPIFANQTIVCPVKAMNKYLKKRSFRAVQEEPLFIQSDNSALSRNVFIQKMKIMLDKLGLESKNYNGHSFRIGAATTGSKVRLEDHLLKTLGRWSSDCYTTYIQTPLEIIKDAQIAMSKDKRS